jgi:hypothetical protein
MLTNVTLTADEFKDLHNAKCELFQVVKTVKETGMMKDLAKQLGKIEKQIDKSLKNAYAQEDKISDSRRRVYDAIAKMHKLTTIWSMYEVSDMSAEHPYKGATILVHKHHNGTRGIEVAIKGNRWYDLYVAADEAIIKSGDMHHCFIEGFTTDDTDEEPGVIVLSVGS